MRWVRRLSLQAVTCRGAWKRRAQNKWALRRARARQHAALSVQ